MIASARPEAPPGGALRRLAASRDGAVAVIAAVGALFVAGSVMFATDLARIHATRSRVQWAVDSASLAAARDLGKPEATVRAIAEQVFDANLPDGYVGATVTAPQVAFSVRWGSDPRWPDTVRVTADVALPLLIADLPAIFGAGGAGPSRFTVSGAATKRTSGAEVVMVLDNTGSMLGSRIAGLRAAATDLKDALFQGRDSVPDLYVGIVPYSATVNIGRQNADWIDEPLASLDARLAPTIWKGCVVERSVASAESDSTPAPGALFPPQVWPSSRISTGPDVFDAFHRTSPNIWPQIKNGRPTVDERVTAGNNGYGPNLGCPAPITPLTASRATVEGAIAQLDAWHRGGTLGNLGLAWGWRAISPTWRGLWRLPDGAPIVNLPFDYDRPFSNKIIVLMTDGENNFYNADYTSYRRENEMIGENQINPSMLRLCAAVKEAGVIVFAITFGTSVTTTIRDTYTQCASNPATEERIVGPKYFHAPTSADLQLVFSTIAGQIQELRLVE